MTTYAKLKNSLDTLGYAPMLEHCTLHTALDGILMIYSFGHPMLLFRPSGNVVIQLAPEANELLEGELRRLNAYLPDGYVVAQHEHYLYLEHQLTGQTWVYKPGITINKDDTITRAGNFDQMTMLIEGIRQAATTLIKTVLETPRRRASFPLDPLALTLWVLEDSIRAQTFSPELTFAIFQSAKANVGIEQQTYWSALINLLKPERFVPLADRPPKPPKVTPETEAVPTRSNGYDTCQYAGHNSYVFCTVKPYGFDGTKKVASCDQCPSWSGDPQRLTLAAQRTTTPITPTVAYETWLRRNKSLAEQYCARRQNYRDIIASLRTDEAMQKLLSRQIEQVLKEHLRPTHIIF